MENGSAWTPSTANCYNQTLNAWYNLTTFAKSLNVSQYAPILEDIFMIGPRIAMRLSSFVVASEAISAFDLTHDSTTENVEHLPPIMSDQKSKSPNMVAASSIDARQESTFQGSHVSLESFQGLSSVFGYATSKWAISCIAMAVILNRTHIFAATRRRLRFRWQIRAVIRILPIFLLIAQTLRLLQSIQCQTSQSFAELRKSDANVSNFLVSYPNPFLNMISSTILLGTPDENSCISAGMMSANNLGSIGDLHGSLSRLWPLFGTFCLSHFLETVSCAVQGRSVAVETGMTLFEQSLAFAEADAAASSRLGWDSFTTSGTPMSGSVNVENTLALSRSMVYKRINTPPEVLLIAFLSSMTHITSHALGIFDLQAKYRLLNTGFWGVCFMGSLVWSFLSSDPDTPSQGFFRFPTVCIIGFVPHVLVFLGIIMCLSIYGLALVLSALVPPANQATSTTLRQRMVHAHGNMQANVTLSELRITQEMDFYTALLRIGFAAITMASEAVYLNEDRDINVKPQTWLEELRYREAEELQSQWINIGLSDPRYDQVGTIGLIPIKGGPLAAPNGYSRERAAQKVSKGRGDRMLRAGIGSPERSSRWIMALEFLLSINKLLGRVAGLSILWFLGLIRVRARPAWLIRLAQRSKTQLHGNFSMKQIHDHDKDKMFTHEPEIIGSQMDCLDIEAEFRRLSQDDETLETDLYNYWVKGGWWGSKDTSGTYAPVTDDSEWDNTSVITLVTDEDESEAQNQTWISDDEGQRTPTKRLLSEIHENTSYFDSPLNLNDLARLLRPTNQIEQEEADTLAAHFQSNSVLTRSGFRRLEQLQRSRVLMPSRGTSDRSDGPWSRITKLSAEEEERLLEQLILIRRQPLSRSDGSHDSGGHEPTASFVGESFPCVVCQCSSRTIIVWPCRCLSLCDDCRVSLAMNNFDKCVCCRRDVMSFSRIYVP